ncbi:sugar phosphate isomerase/epimerase family protein [Novosphingobium panipatense]|uniref:Sugar phosphate isomerase/epimerase n=1 Tax=Novosphingobium panipatense TaxID=428991 RepID=A0ABY1QB95_9SPHN|nr:sugar phosphate isomerase/epimerase [Novosphingobium panipatense]SMP61833.1 Sugar phosphate isomerase/epimerase [Novosphingobium panipatense]
MPHPFGLDQQTVLGLDPVAHVGLAADLGCRTVTLGLARNAGGENPHRYPPWSLREDAVLVRETKAALRDGGVVIAVGTGCDISQQIDASQRAADMDMFAELGAVRVSASDMGAERERAFDQFGALAEMAAARGMELCIAFSPVLTMRSLPDALQVIARIGAQGGPGSATTVLIDAMHFFRSGGTVQQVAELDPALIGHVQLCDVPLRGTGDYMAESTSGRMIPGQGELPLREFVEALPRGQVLGLDVPLIGAARSGRDVRDYVGEILRRTREYLA